MLSSRSTQYRTHRKSRCCIAFLKLKPRMRIIASCMKLFSLIRWFIARHKFHRNNGNFHLIHSFHPTAPHKYNQLRCGHISIGLVYWLITRYGSRWMVVTVHILKRFPEESSNLLQRLFIRRTTTGFPRGPLAVGKFFPSIFKKFRSTFSTAPVFGEFFKAAFADVSGNGCAK